MEFLCKSHQILLTFVWPIHSLPFPLSLSQKAIWRSANVASGRQCRRRFANLGPTLATNLSPEMVGKCLASQCCITTLIPTLDQCWKSDHKLNFSQNSWWIIGKGLASHHLTANLIPMLGQRWHSDHLLLFLKNHWQVVGNWSDSQCLMLMLTQCQLANQ